jgi:hypothetical protein
MTGKIWLAHLSATRTDNSTGWENCQPTNKMQEATLTYNVVGNVINIDSAKKANSEIEFFERETVCPN